MQANSDQQDLRPKGTPIGRQTLSEVDAGLMDCEKLIKSASEGVRARLTANSPIPTTLLRDLARGNAQRSKLVLRRVTLLLDAGDANAIELVEKLMKVKPKA